MKFSIITATYNSAASVETAINSVLTQSYKSIEYIIIDGASSDNTVNLVDNIIKESNKYADSEFSYKIISEKDNGIYDALNKGINNSTGDIIGFVHSDDFLATNDVLQSIADAFEDNNTDSVYGDLQYVSKDNTEKVIRNWISGKFEKKKLKRGWMPPHPSFFVKKSVYDKIGVFDTSLKIAADYDFMMRALWKHSISTSYIPKTLNKMRLGGESNRSLKNLIKKSLEDYQVMRKNGIGGLQTLFLKNACKIKQFILK